VGKPVRTLKVLAKNEAALRRTCRRLARDLVRACAGLPHNAPGSTVDKLLNIAAQLEGAGQRIVIEKPTRPTKKEPRHAV
jgi:hypothetical protein